MIILTTGTPGSGKTLFSVNEILKREELNKKHLKQNPQIFQRNFSTIENNCDSLIKIDLKDFDGDQEVFQYITDVLKDYDQTEISITNLFDLFQSFSSFQYVDRYERYFRDSVIYNLLIDLINRQLDLKLEHILDVRQQYADINGLQVENVLNSPEDWRTTPDGSIVYYDEAQQHERFRSGTQANKDGIVQKLQVHRHTGHDIVFITQSPRFLNAFVLDLVGEHYHLHRPYGAKLASVYYWRSCRKQPQSQSSKEVAENEFLFKYPKEIFKYYKSATAHSVKFKIPKKFWWIAGFALFLIFLVSQMVFSDKTQKFINPEKPQQTQKKELEQNSHDIQISAEALDQECRKGVNVEKPECVEWFNNLTNESKKNDNGTYNISFNPNNPYELDYNQFQYQVQDTPRFVGCVKFDGKYYGYTQQGTRLQIKQSDCERYMNGDRPFDPMYRKQEYNYAGDNYSSNYQQDRAPSTEEIAKMEQAKMEGLI